MAQYTTKSPHHKKVFRGTGRRGRCHSDADRTGEANGLKKPVSYYSVLYNVNDFSPFFVAEGSYLKLRELSLTAVATLPTSFDVYGRCSTRSLRAAVSRPQT